MYCENCGNFVNENERFCSSCGYSINLTENASNDSEHKYKGKKRMIIACVAIVISAVLVMGLLFGSKIEFGNKSDDTNNVHVVDSTSDRNNNTIENTTQNNITANEYLNNKLLKKYEFASENVTLEYRYIDGQRYFYCENFKNLIIDYYIKDLNSDGYDDIYVLLLEKSDAEKKQDGQYANIYLNKNIYFSDENKDFNLYYSGGESLSSQMRDSISQNIEYGLIQDESGKYNILKTVITEDNSEICEGGNIYYAPEDSLGKYIVSLNVDKISDRGFSKVLTAQLFVDHMLGIPEAENKSYKLTIGDGALKELFFSGVNSVTTGTNYPTPLLRSEERGDCASESEACETINNEIKSLGFNDLSVSPFVWENRKENSFSLEKCCQNRINLFFSTKETDDSSGQHVIKISKCSPN